jgi:hypothetical protein
VASCYPPVLLPNKFFALRLFRLLKRAAAYVFEGTVSYRLNRETQSGMRCERPVRGVNGIDNGWEKR